MLQCGYRGWFRSFKLIRLHALIDRDDEHPSPYPQAAPYWSLGPPLPPEGAQTVRGTVWMSMHLPTLKQLQYLVALRNHGHFGRAADACFVTQSTLSAGIKELETLIGVTLVERTRRVVRFTPLGERVAAKARRILRDAEDMADMVRA